MRFRKGDNAEVISKQIYHVTIKLLIFLGSSEGAIDPAEVNSWMPSPHELAKYDQAAYMHVYCSANVLALGARAFERLGRDDDAATAAQLGIDQHKKKVVISDCQRTLGRVAARRGDEAGAQATFVSAAETAQIARMPLLALFAGRDLKRHVPAQSAKGDQIIDAACARMGKERARFASALEFEA